MILRYKLSRKDCYPFGQTFKCFPKQGKAFSVIIFCSLKTGNVFLITTVKANYKLLMKEHTNSPMFIIVFLNLLKMK